MKVGVLFGGRSPEHEVSLMSAEAVMDALAPNFDVVPIGIDPSGRFLVGGDPLSALKALAGRGETAGAPAPSARALEVLAGVDVVFPVLHGPNGEDGTVQGLLEVLGVPYVGSGVLASALGMDKAAMKSVFQEAGLPVGPWRLVREADWRRRPEAVWAGLAPLRLPVFVKPANMGSSIGINRVDHWEGLPDALEVAFQLDRRVVVEEGLTVRELECGVLGNDEPEASPVGEILPEREFYDYEAKYGTGTRTVVPAELPPAVSERARELALAAFRAVDASGLARVDFFYTRDGALYVNEINTMPGFTPYSMYPKLWAAGGLTYAELLARLVLLGLERHRQKERRIVP